MAALVVSESMPLDDFSGLDVGDVSDGGLIELMVAARRSVSRMQAVELAAVAELARRRDAEDDVSGVGIVSAREYLNDEVVAALTLTAASADDLIRFATELTGRLPATFSALAAGQVDYCRARTVWHATAQVGDEVAARIEARVLPRAPVQTTGQIRAKIRRLVKRLDPDTLARRKEHAERQRDVQLLPTDDGTAHLSGLDLPADAATAARNRVNAIATGLKKDGDRRGIGQLRADVFLALLSGTLTSAEPPADATRPITGPHADDTRGEDGWTGIDDAVADAIAQAARDHLSAFPGEPAGSSGPERHRRVGEFIARAARDHLSALPDQVPGSGGPERYQGLDELIASAGERIVEALAGLKTRWCAPAPDTDPDRDPAPDTGPARGPGHGHQGYRVPVRMRRLIEIRDRRCGFPGCRRPVPHCDADHTVPYHRDGPTCPCNIAMLCRHHHALKQTPGWRLHQLWPGVLLWIGPTGHWRITTPPDRE